jgi:leucyl aminopeptidase
MLKNNINTQIFTDGLAELKSEGLVVTLFQDADFGSNWLTALNEYSGGLLKSLVDSGEIRGEQKEFNILHLPQKPVKKLIVLGCGKKESVNRDTVRFIAAKGARTARRISQQEVSFLMDPFFEFDAEVLGICFSEGLLMGLDRFELYKTKKKCDSDKLENVVVSSVESFDSSAFEKGIARGRILAEGNIRARDIANHPGNYMTPAQMANEALEIAKETGMDCTVMDEPELIEKGFQGITSVSQGSVENCKLIIMDYKGMPESSDIHMAIVGKGLTFDAGGISIKPSAGMHMMKYDMCGGAATLGAALIVGKLKPKANIRFYVPSSENLCGDKAYKPGDIIKMYGGKTVEIQNTDAEGRLLLADSIALAVEHKAQRIIDVATLTGAAVVALGHVRTGLMCKDDDLKNLVKTAAEECDEKLWELPLDDEYKVSLKTSHADISNSGGRAGGTISAAMFLNEFSGEVPFCHLDIAGTAWIENVPSQYAFKPYLPKEGASGTAARTLALSVERLADAINE